MVSVITNVGLDHTAQLGNNLEEIAYQKAGIVKRRVPLVSGVVHAGARAVIQEVTAEMHAPFWEVRGETRALPARIGLLGDHQRTNAAVAVAAIERLRDAGMPIPNSAIIRGLADVRWPARIEIISERPYVILDTAHNVPSIESLVKTLSESCPARGMKRVVFAVSADKNAREMLRVLAGYFDRFHFTRYANPRSLPPEKLATLLADIAPGKASSINANSADAWISARQATRDRDLICVTGSVFLAGELRHVVR
jgi:dihydrofolate synthase/folylpolyglutamate synthase